MSTKKKPPGQIDMKKKARSDEWDAARILFEREPTETYGTIATILGVSRQRVRSVALEDGWRKTSDLHAVVGAAQVQADKKFTVSHEPAGGVREAKPSDPITPGEVHADQKAADLRAAVLEKHRKELSVPRALLQESFAGKERDLGKAKLAKIAAETLKIVQDAERKAWGMDTVSETPAGTSNNGAPGTRLIIVRTTAPHAAS